MEQEFSCQSNIFMRPVYYVVVTSDHNIIKRERQIFFSFSADSVLIKRLSYTRHFKWFLHFGYQRNNATRRLIINVMVNYLSNYRGRGLLLDNNEKIRLFNSNIFAIRIHCKTQESSTLLGTCLFIWYSFTYFKSLKKEKD